MPESDSFEFSRYRVVRDTLPSVLSAPLIGLGHQLLFLCVGLVVDRCITAQGGERIRVGRHMFLQATDLFWALECGAERCSGSALPHEDFVEGLREAIGWALANLPNPSV